jgi:hypothetical protein
MTTEPFDSDVPAPRRDRREHGGASEHQDDDALALRTERERVEAGLAAYAPEDVPPATDTPPVVDPADSAVVQEIEGVALRQEDEGETAAITKDHPFPPTRYAEE